MGHTMKNISTGLTAMGKNLGARMQSRTPAPSAPESRVEKVSRLARVAMDKAERAVHDAKNAKTFKAAKKKMAVAQKHLSAAYRACEKAKA